MTKVIGSESLRTLHEILGRLLALWIGGVEGCILVTFWNFQW
jgi:hypothetical protein